MATIYRVPITFRVEPAVARFIKRKAKEQKKTTSNFIREILLQAATQEMKPQNGKKVA